ncbi:MAG: hypothetical protein ACRDXB_22955, partial [Actinomycetes bacterium]
PDDHPGPVSEAQPMSYVFECRRYPQLQVGPGSRGVRFDGGRYTTDDPTVAESLLGLPDSFGVVLIEAPTAEDVESPPGGGEGDGSGPGDARRPTRSAHKAEWAAYARAVAESAEELDAIDDMTKEQLVEAYGAEAGKEGD